MRTKYSSDEAFHQLQIVDVIFPQYESHFNVSDAENSSKVREILSERIRNIENKLQKLEENIANGAEKVHKQTLNIIVGLLTVFVSFCGRK
jgi:hypothetical protein